MAHDTDFIDLYAELGVLPGCTPGEFKQAYRRRMAALHPDRRLDPIPDPCLLERAQRLTATYAAAVEFERRHGRLPGSVVRARPAPSVRVAVAASAPPPARRRSAWLLLLLGTIVFAGLLRGLWAAPVAAPGAADRVVSRHGTLPRLHHVEDRQP